MTNLNEDDNLAHRTEVKNNELHVEKKDVAKKILRKHEPVDYKREDILKKARAKAHDPAADAKRKISNEMRQNGLLEGIEQYWTHFDFGCNESYDFLEGPIGFSDQPLIFEMYKKPQVSDAILEALDVVQEDYVDPKCHTIGMFEGCFAPIGVMSRNNRIYDEDHYPYLLQNVLLENKVKTRAMLGTIGHHNKKVDDEDLAEEKVSHVITNLEVRERADGTRYLYGRAEILNTKAGRSLRTYYRHRIPLYVSSRGGGKLLDIPGQDYKRVDKTRYYLETFDVVKDPGFLDARPVANVAVEIDENINKEYNGEDEMKNEEKVISENIEVKEEVTAIVEEATEEVSTTIKEKCEDKEDETEEKIEEATAETIEEKCDDKEEDKPEEDKEDEKEDVQESAEETSEIVDEKKEDKSEEDKEEKVEEAVETVEESSESIEEKCEDKDEKVETDEEPKEEGDKDADEVTESVETVESSETIEEKCDDKEEDKEEKVEEKVEEAVEEDYKAKYEALTPVIEELLAMVKDSAESLKQVLAENADSKAKISELSEKLEALSKVEVIEEAQDETDAGDDTHVDDSDETDGNADATESLEETTSETIEEKCDDKEEDKEEEKVEDEACHESEEKAEELGEQIAESVEGMDLVDTVETTPVTHKPPVFSVFNKKADMTPSKWYSRFSK